MAHIMDPRSRCTSRCHTCPLTMVQSLRYTALVDTISEYTSHGDSNLRQAGNKQGEEKGS